MGAQKKTEVPRISVDAPIDDILSIWRDQGGVILQNVLTPKQVQSINADIKPKLDKLSAGSKHDLDVLKSFHGSNTKRLTNVTSQSPTFRNDYLNHPVLRSLCQRIFQEESGSWWVCSTQVIEIGPGNAAQPLHRDQSQYPVFDQLGLKGPDATVNFLVALTDFTEENGGTRFIPESHKWEDYSQLGDQSMTIPCEMEAGDVLFISGKVVHGGGANRTVDEKRRCISMGMNASYLTPEEAHPFLIPMEIARTLTPYAQQILGFRSQYPIHSPGLWQSDYSELAEYLGLDG
ncbi:hypothetical protein BKA61DRAFT_537400 [Leptodontidium sp. MPI-SDFR-AT-0119]|nr:hypothetical protein BKA61DRAFT_537400 [Leptodontidium sp. MPI-SDFR-AT-0119]